MKCPNCNGTGKSEYGYNQPCTNCNRKGFVEPLTNDEWRKICSAKEFAEFLFGIAYMCSYCGDEAHSTKEKIQKCHFGKCVCQRQDWEEWLKQPHTSQTPQKQDDCPCKVKGCSFETRQACCGCIDYFKWKGGHER